MLAGFDPHLFDAELDQAIGGTIEVIAPMLARVTRHNGVVEWRQRNHYFFDWCQRSVDNGLCRWLTLPGETVIRKTCDSQKGLETRRFTMHVIPRAVLLANKATLKAGDIVGFVSHRADLDYFHAGMIALKGDGTVLLRHAAESERRVLDERLEGFLARWRVRYVTLVRPQEPRATA